MSPKSLKFFKFLKLLALLLCSTSLHAQYRDHRNRHVDSLEHLLATNPPTGSKLVDVYSSLTWGYSEIDYQKSMDYARKYIEIAISLNDWWDVSSGFRILGMHFYHLSQYDSAQVYYGKAFAAADRMRDFPEKYTERNIDDEFSMLYGNMGNFYNIQGKYHEAIEYYQKALILFEKYGWKRSQSIAYQNIGEMYLSMNNHEQAEINYMKCDAIAHEINDSLRISDAKLRLGKISVHRGDYDKALEHANIAYRYLFSLREVGAVKAEILNLLSQIYLEGFDNDLRAEEYAREALQIANDLDNPREKSSALGNLAIIYLKRGEWRRAEQTALEALDTDDSEPANTLALYEILAKAYGMLGNGEKANEYFDKHNALQASWSNKNYQSSLRELEVKYETEKKEHEIERQQRIISQQNMYRSLLVAGIVLCIAFLALLWYMLRLRTRRNLALSERNDALSERAGTLAEMNATKDKFFSIISHDLKNPAVAQRDALQMLVDNACLWDTDALTGYCEKLLKTADGHVELIFNLLNWAKLQTSRITYTPATIVLSSFLPDISLISKMAENKGIAFVVDMPKDAIITGDSNMLATVLRNLLTNAVKFTPAGGTVTLQASPNPSKGGGFPPPSGELEGAFIVSVSDTGVGMSREQVEMLRETSLQRTNVAQSRAGTAHEQGSGLGLIVCRELLEMHGSELHVESEEGKGSRFWFEV